MKMDCIFKYLTCIPCLYCYRRKDKQLINNQQKINELEIPNIKTVIREGVLTDDEDSIEIIADKNGESITNPIHTSDNDSFSDISNHEYNSSNESTESPVSVPSIHSPVSVQSIDSSHLKESDQYINSPHSTQSNESLGSPQTDGSINSPHSTQSDGSMGSTPSNESVSIDKSTDSEDKEDDSELSVDSNFSAESNSSTKWVKI